MIKYRSSILFLLLIIGCFINTTHAQQAITAAGGDATGTGGSVAFSIGQVNCQTYTQQGITISEGVQKAHEFYGDTIHLPEGDLIISNYVSPNGDGQNDTWKINNLDMVKNYAITIVDSWGNKVFGIDSNYNNEFDGTSSGKKLLDGVYYYIISTNGKTKYSGSITLLR